MKRILSLWLAALIMAVQPAQAVVMVGFGQSAGGSGFVLDDDLYEASSTNITSHTVSPGPGGSWSNGTYAANVSTDGASSAGAYIAVPYNNITPFADGYVVIEGATLNSSRSMGSLIRYDGTSLNGYKVTLSGAGALTLSRVDSGTSTSLDTDTCSGHVVTTTYQVKIIASGSNISADVREVGGSSICSATATDGTYASGVPAISINNTAPRITNVKAYKD